MTHKIINKLSKRAALNFIVIIVVVAFTLLCHYLTYRRAYIQGYKQAIEDEVEYLKSQTELTRSDIKLIERALTILENVEK
ncbi:MAG: hypothetical protein IKW46_02195 [Bacteroidaceae bacterium]|nr:hypothetical protein [Bacteroidaceae bacterium]